MVLLLFQYIFLPTSMWRQIICPRIRCFQVSLSPSGGSCSFSYFGPSRGGSVGIFSFHSMPALLHLGIFTTSGGVGVECLQPSMDVSFSWISSSGSVQVSGKTCQRSTQTIDSGGTILDGGSLAPHSSQHVGRCSSVVPCHKRSCCGCLSRPGTQGSALSAFKPLAAEQCVLCRQGFSSLGQWQGQIKHLHQRSTSSVGRNGQDGVLYRVYQTMPSLPLN